MQRLFIALELPDDIREYLWENISSKLRKSKIRVSWVRPENMHITLKFLGDTEVDVIPQMTECLDRVFAKYDLIESSIGDCGTFGGRNPRVVWVSSKGGEEIIAQMASDVNDALEKIGIEKDKRQFKSHITLGRVRDRKGADIKDSIKKLEYDNLPILFHAAVLMKSELTPHGAIYEPVKVWNFI